MLIAVILCLISLAGQFAKYYLGHGRLLGLVPLFDVDNEASLPTWFSSVILLLSGVLFGVIAAGRKAIPATDRLHWIMLAVIFALLSADEAAMIHETLIVQPLFAASGSSSLRYLAWVLPGILITLVFVAFYWRFWRRLPRRTQLQFLLAGGLFVTGALGMELTAGVFLASGYQLASFPYATLTTIEEGLEMSGIIVLINALLAYMSGEGIEATCVKIEDH